MASTNTSVGQAWTVSSNDESFPAYNPGEMSSYFTWYQPNQPPPTYASCVDPSPAGNPTAPEVLPTPAEVRVNMANTGQALPDSTTPASNDFGGSFSDKSIRRGFIQKVFGILAIQMVVTIGIICTIYFVPVINSYVYVYAWPYITFSSLALVLMIVLICMKDIRRKWPINIICLMLFTVFESIMLGTLMTYFSVQEILIAFGIVLVIVSVMFILGFQQKFDFTWCLGIVVILFFCMMMYGILILIYPGTYVVMAYATLGAILFSLYLLVDIQMIVGGKHKQKFSPEDYIFAALAVYLDIVYIFIFLLILIGAKK